MTKALTNGICSHLELLIWQLREIPGCRILVRDSNEEIGEATLICRDCIDELLSEVSQ